FLWDLLDLLFTVYLYNIIVFFFFSSRRRHTRFSRDWSSDVCSSDLYSCSCSNYIVNKEYFFTIKLVGIYAFNGIHQVDPPFNLRSEERRVGKECRSRGLP